MFKMEVQTLQMPVRIQDPGIGGLDSGAPPADASNYHVLPITLLLIGGYFFTHYLFRKGILKPQKHKRIWNLLLVGGYLGTGVTGVLLTLMINLGISTIYNPAITYWHAELAILMVVRTLIHIHIYRKPFKNMFKVLFGFKSRSEKNDDEKSINISPNKPLSAYSFFFVPLCHNFVPFTRKRVPINEIFVFYKKTHFGDTVKRFSATLTYLLVHKIGVQSARIISALHERPYNANKLSEKLNTDYKTVRYHIKILEDNQIIQASGGKYGAMYFLSSQLENNYELFKHIWNEIETVEGHGVNHDGHFGESN